MRFKEGSSVEVLRRREQCESWFPGKIISIDDNAFIVRYELFLNSDGNHVIEKVSKEDIRPQPLLVEGRERWVFGDIVEVFDVHSWRVGKVAKVLSNNRFVIKLFGSIQLKEFHRYNLRLRQTWRGSKWNLIGKVDGNKKINKNLRQNSPKYSPDLDYGAPQQGMHEEIHTRKRDGRAHPESFFPERSYKRKLGDAVCSPKKKMGKKCMIGSEMDIEKEKTNNYSSNPFSMPVRVIKESNECSVASCSSNDVLEYSIQKNSRKSSWYIADCSFNDAKSGRKYLPSYAEDELETDVHKLEVQAYKSTMQALYASGPLSWEHESLLTNLRIFLHISDEEHLVHLKHLLSAQVL